MLLDVRPPAPRTKTATRSSLGRRAVLAGVAAAALLIPVFVVDGEPAGSLPLPAQPARPADPPPADGAVDPEALTLQTSAGVVVADPHTGEMVKGITNGVASPDGSVVARAEPHDGGTRLTIHDVDTDAVAVERPLPGRLEVQLVGWDGETVVLGPESSGETAAYVPQPRSHTSIVVSRASGARTFELEGNYEPEALSRDGGSLFVISYLPPLEPDRYQVRRLDLGSGSVEEVFTPDEELQQEMGGTARVQAFSPGGDRLYTLYTLGEGGSASAFVHVLDLDGLWAHCIDLPEWFTVRDEHAIGMGVSPDGQELYVADGVSGQLLHIDTERLAVERSGSLPMSGTAVSVVAATADQLVVGADEDLWIVDPQTFGVTVSTAVPTTVVGVRVREDDGRLLAILGDRRVAVLDPGTGERTDLYRVRGTAPVESVSGGGGIRVGTQRSDVIKCAC